MSNTTVAQTILQQLGGQRFIVMTGSKNFIDCGNALSMKLTKNNIGAQYLTITLNSMDTYDMVFSKIKKTINKEYKAIGLKIYDEELVELKEVNGVYCDQLQQIFKSVTGLETKL